MLWLTTGLFCTRMSVFAVEGLTKLFSDALETFKSFKSSQKLVSISMLQRVESSSSLSFNFFKPQSIGVFLDLSCEDGFWLLQQSLNMFNRSYRWLIWDPDFDKTLLSLNSSRISLDTDITFISPEMKVLDLYRIHPLASWVVTDIGNWTKSGDFNLVARPDRNNFNGFNFNTSLMMTEIEFNKTNLIEPLMDNSFEIGKDMMRRYGLSLFLDLAEYFNFTMTYVLTNAWGDLQKNGSWPGMVGQVLRGEAEFGTAPAKFITERYPFIDYIVVVNHVRHCFTFMQPKLFGTYKSLILPLDKYVWTGLGISVVLGILAFRAVSKYDKTSLHNENWSGSILLAFSSVAQQGFPDNTYQLSTRIVYLSLLWVTFLTAIYYNTSILNGLLLQAPNAIQNIEQLLHSDIELRLIDNPYSINEMTNWNDTLTIRVREKLHRVKPPEKLIYEINEGVKYIKKGYAMYTEDEDLYTEMMLTMSDAEICSITEVEKYQPFAVGMIARENSPYKEAFSRIYYLMFERGTANRQKQHWMIPKPECHWKQDAIALGTEPLFLAYLVLGIGFVLASVFFIGEYFMAKKSENYDVIFKPIIKAQ